MYGIGNRYTKPEKISAKRAYDLLAPYLELVGTTMGPKGSTVLVDGGLGNHKISKDGVTVLTGCNPENRIGNILLGFIIETCKGVEKKTGDGTTTTSMMILKGLEYASRNSGMSLDTTRLKEDMEMVIDYAKEMSSMIPLDMAMIKKVAMSATNGDVEITENLLSSVGTLDNFKNVEIVKPTGYNIQRKDHVKKIDRLTIDGGAPDGYFLRGEIRQRVKASVDNVYIVHDKLSVEKIKEYQEEMIGTDSFVIISPHFSEEVMSHVYDINSETNSNYIHLLTVNGLDRDKDKYIEDIRCYIKGSKYVSFIYTIDIIDILKSDVFDDTPRKERILSLRNNLDIPGISVSAASIIKRRICSLEANGVEITVGGETPGIIQERFERYEDGLGSIIQAMTHGVIPSGGLFQKQIAKKLKVSDWMSAILASTFDTIFSDKNVNLTGDEGMLSSCNVITDKISGPNEEEYIVDSLSVFIECLKSSVEILTLFKSLNGGIVSREIKEVN